MGAATIIDKVNGVATVESIATLKRLPPDFLQTLFIESIDGGGISIPYLNDSDGEELFRRERENPRRKGRDGKILKFYQPAGIKLKPYLLWKLADARRFRKLYIVEGESDTWTLHFHELPVLGIPGANSTRCLTRDALDSINEVIVWREPGNPGKTFVEGVRNALVGMSWKGTLIVIDGNGVKDVSDLHCLHPDHGKFLEALQGCLSRGKSEQIKPQPTKKGSPRRLRPVPEFRPFPVEALPEPLASFVLESATALGCDPAWIALACLVVVASLIGNKRNILLKRGWREPCVLWGVIVGLSGSLKTPALRSVMDIVQELQDELREKFDKEVEAYDVLVPEWADRKAKAKKEGGTFSDPPPKKPVLDRLILGDVTIEKVCEVLEDCPRGLLLFRDEVSAWFGSFMKYKAKGAGSDCPIYLSMYSANSIQLDRKTGERPSLYIPRAALSILGGIQPSILARSLTAEHFENGLSARLLLAMPPATKKRWKEDEVSEATRDAVLALFKELLSLDFDRTKGKPLPLSCWLPNDAKALWVDWYNSWAEVQARTEGELASAYSKLEAVAARLALLHHVVTDAHDSAVHTAISPASMQSGIVLARWFAHEAERVYGVLKESEDERRLRELIELIGRHGGSITARDLRHASKSRYPDNESAKAALEELVEMGLGYWDMTPSSSKGGRPTAKLILLPRNPETYETSEDAFAERDEAEDETPFSSSK